MGMQNTEQMAATPAWKSPWVIGWVASIFVVLGANLFMVYLAIDTNPGLVVQDYYERGQDYEKHMFSKRAEDPGWHMTIGMPKDLVAGTDIPVQFTVLDKAGVPVRPEAVTFHAYRPSDSSRDFDLPMESAAAGLYTAKVRFRLKGVWDILVSVKAGEHEYHAGQRIYLAAPDA